MKIAFILPSLEMKGPIVYVYYLIQGLKTKVENIEIFYFKDIIELEMGVPISKIHFLQKVSFDQFDIVHSHGAIPDLYAFKSDIRNKWVSTMHDMYREQLQLTHNFLYAQLVINIWSFALRRIKNMVVFSEVLEKYYRQSFGDKNYRIIPTGVPHKNLLDVENKDRNLLIQLAEKYTILGSSGLLTKRKGYKQLIDFLRYNDNYVVVITGDGEEYENLKMYASEHGVEDRFFLLGFKKNSIDYLRYYHIFVLPSYAEGLPLSLLEAISQKLPIVCSNLDIYSDYFNDDDVAFFELENPKSLENAIHRVNCDLEYFKRRSAEIYTKKFSLEVMAYNYLTYYQEVSRRNIL